MHDHNRDNPEESFWEDIHEREIPASSARQLAPGGKQRKALGALSRQSTTAKKLRRLSRAAEAGPATLAFADRCYLFYATATPYILGILEHVLRFLRIPFSVLLCIWCLAWLLGSVAVTTKAALSSFCFLPGVSSAALCLPVAEPKVISHADFPRLMYVQDKTLAELLDENGSGSALALHMKKAQMATTDLSTLVEMSDLLSRDQLVSHLRTIAQQANTASDSLGLLTSKVFGAVDRIMSFNDYTLRSIGTARSTPDRSIFRHLIPWRTSSMSSVLITKSFETSMIFISSTIQTLVVAFEDNRSQLNDLEQKLETLNQMVSREGITVTSARSELLGQLWTLLGGNRQRLLACNSNLELLTNLNQYRTLALAHVVSALQKLHQMNTDLEALRQAVTKPELAGGRIPVEVHIGSIQRSLERLKQSQGQAQARQDTIVKQAYFG
ncbi:hypothetical protein C8R47DRAFT_981908 [Mycena vitilis]|nr:hypothetical protein C8R47DRAFT_981908 [Mycena vitilis]